MKLYHVEVAMPMGLLCRAQTTQFNELVWSRHAKTELLNDKYGLLPVNKIPLSFDATGWELIELEVEDEKITKYVFRRPVDEKRSMVIALRPAGEGIAVVVTCWTNLNTDKHKTLDRSKYAHE